MLDALARLTIRNMPEGETSNEVSVPSADSVILVAPAGATPNMIVRWHILGSTFTSVPAALPPISSEQVAASVSLFGKIIELGLTSRPGSPAGAAPQLTKRCASGSS